MNILTEIIVCIFYIGTLTFVFIHIPPTAITCSLLAIYVAATTTHVVRLARCSEISRIPFVFGYTVFCLTSYVAIYYIFHKYRKFRFTLLLTPFLFLLVVKAGEKLLGCEKGGVYSSLGVADMIITNLQKT
jgi:hypothetical protein